ncbi:MAG TPA: hypothetical protein VFT46_10870 [Holophagaceae bacterium]|nr:hypothetical protein [Holophagaceae bacterium]
MPRTTSLILPALVVTLALPVRAEGRGPSTPQERDRVLALAASAAQDPLGTYARDGRWFDQWLDQIPDLTFGPEAPARWCESNAKGDLRRLMRFEYELGGVVYQIQHQVPQARTLEEKLAVHQAALEQVLKAYASLRDAKPENRSPKMDEALALRDKGELPAFVKSLFEGGR